jgi:lysyl-tRNA synthetase class 2
MEVDPPLLATTSVTDINIESIGAQAMGQSCFLQTSPEFFMKRLLANGSGDIYSLGKSFRQDEIGEKHNPEFCLLEWYRCGWDEHQLMAEVVELVEILSAINQSSPISTSKMTYSECVSNVLGFDPHQMSLEKLRDFAANIGSKDWLKETRENCLDLIFSVAVEPKLPAGLVLVYDYPACQAALSQIDRNSKGHPISRRFEVFYNKIEIGNGYFELLDAVDQNGRFDMDIESRLRDGKPFVGKDKKFIDAVEAGLPPCAGIAIGVDRLLMGMLGSASIDEVMSFSWPRT